MKYKLKVLQPRTMSGERINGFTLMFLEDDLKMGQELNIFDGKYKVIEVLK